MNLPSNTRKADNFLRHLTKDQIEDMKDRIFQAEGIVLRADNVNELYDELVKYRLITVQPKKPESGV